MGSIFLRLMEGKEFYFSSKQVRQIIAGMSKIINQKKTLLRPLKSTNLTKENYAAANSTYFTPSHKQ